MGDKKRRPVIGVTMGDGAGIGPEIVVKALVDEAIHAICRPLVIGDARRLELAASIVGVHARIVPVESARELPDHGRAGELHVLDMKLLPDDLPFGVLSAAAGEAAYRYLERAVQLAMSGEIDAICTAPLNKEALHLAGRMYPGHTEILAALTNTRRYAMLLSGDRLNVIHVTTHIGLLDAIASITPERIAEVIRLGNGIIARKIGRSPRIAVCAINPHAGEGGLFGRGEEERLIAPAIERTSREGIDVTGPLAADTVFYRAVRGDFDLVVAMYHDQGHAPFKVLGLDAGVNVTVGLPVVRTSVDHGTAFDIAGKGIASAESMKEAIRQAVGFV